MDLAKRSTCANCQKPFRADARNAWHQRYCKAPACRAASKVASQQRWCAKPENRDYFSGPDNVARVRAWREQHPDYGARPAPTPAPTPTPTPSPSPSPAKLVQRAPAARTLQDLVAAQVLDLAARTACPATPELAAASALQDLLMQQPIVLIGLLAHLSDSTLQDDIALAGRRLLQLGHDVLGGANHDHAQARAERAAAAAHPGAVQLDRPAPGVRGAPGAL